MSAAVQSGLLTFLFTDLEDSTRLWEQFPESMQLALARHDALLQQAVESHGGRIVKSTGDGLHAVFESPAGGISAALAAQQAMVAGEWPAETGPLKVRMGLHTGESQDRGGDYYGPEVNLAARVMGLSHGGQVLLSDATAALSRKALPPECSLLDLGEHRLRGIAASERIFQLQHPDLAAAFPAIKSLEAFPHNLPRQLSSFIGRERELSEIRRLLGETRLLTLLGPGGTGKTRLMLQAAEEVIEAYSDGVWLVELAPITDPDLIAERAAAALNLQEQSGRDIQDTLTDYLRRKELLLLLDNVEHLVRESAELAEGLLESCPRLTILVTGREALFIGGETTVQIPSLSLPPPSLEVNGFESLEQSEAVQLFIARACAVNPDFSLNRQNAPALAEVVRRLDGIPLALELAASRLSMLTVEKIAERLNDRFRLLTGGRRTALPRQQTLKALIDWSWQLLDDRERILLRRLSVFSGGWSLRAAEEVCGFDPLDELDVFDLLDQLIKKSLVTVEHLPDGESRYGMLESIRQYARDHLFEAEEGELLRDRHAEYFVVLTEAADQELPKRDAIIWVGRLRRNLDNLRAVVAWTQEERLGLTLRLIGHLRHNRMHWISPREADTWLSRIVPKARDMLAASDPSILPSDFIKALVAYGFNLMLLGRQLELVDVAEEARTLARTYEDDRLLASALGIYGIAHAFQLMPDILGEIEEAIRICRENDFFDELAGNLTLVGGSYFLAGDVEKGEPYLEEAFRIRLELGGSPGIAEVANTRGGMAWLQGDWENARAFTSKALEQYEILGSRQGVNMCQSRLAHIHRALGEIAEAEAIYRKTIHAWQELGNLPAVVHQLECFAFLRIAEGKYALGARLIGAAKAARERLKAPSFSPLEIADMERAMAQLTEAMGEEELETFLASDSTLSLDEAILLATGDNSA